MMVQPFVVGMFLTNCYLATCEVTKATIIIDPGFSEESEAKSIFKFITEKALRLRFIVNTHGHPDHTCGNGIVKERFGVPVLIHEYDAHMLGEQGKSIAQSLGFEYSSSAADELLHEGDLVKFGCHALRVIHTPGHSRGSMLLLGENECFSGDTLFQGSIGRTDFPESSEKDMKYSLKKLARLPNRLVVYPGHGPATTLGDEKRNNPFLQ